MCVELTRQNRRRNVRLPITVTSVRQRLQEQLAIWHTVADDGYAG